MRIQTSVFYLLYFIRKRIWCIVRQLSNVKFRRVGLHFLFVAVLYGG
ncbi:hypothetical protein Thiowin_02692 [Thiorhodovibrio winogradskyi]|uniref:Uncharacterized protein n=1 Tax=Thiorhodovibrio winogradskyi TaxID=77007 RepID=A0ABZ0S9Q5_9GAMM